MTALAVAGAELKLDMTVHMYNWAHVAPGTLTAAESEGSRIFREAGVRVLWLNCPLSPSEAKESPICAEPCPLGRFVVRIVSDVPAGQDLGLSRQAAMLFLPGEAKRIRAQVIARTVGQLSPTSVELPISDLTAASSQIFAHEPSSSAALAERLNIHLGSPEAKLVVRLYDYAHVPSRVLTRAEHETARIFQIAGIQLSWVECGPPQANTESFLNCEHVTDPLGLYVTVLPQHMAAWLRRPSRFGTSFGTRAVVFHHQVEETARNESFSEALILGSVMAHELGHLLLGKNHGRGVMTDTFVRRDFVSAEKGELVFTPEQAEQMRARISRALER